MNNLNGKSFVARKPCGCMVGAVVAVHVDAGEAVAKWIKEGLTIETVDHEVVRREFMGSECPHGEHQPQQIALFAEDAADDR